MLRWRLPERSEACPLWLAALPHDDSAQAGGPAASVEAGADERKQRMDRAFATAHGGEPTLWVRAPGRVDLMGSHTDYNHGHVLTLSIGRETWLAARPRADQVVACYSTTTGDGASFCLDVVTRDRDVPWTNYIRGVAQVLRDEGLALRGCDILVDSTIPIGRGLSSSAALEVAAALVFGALGGWQMDPVRLARLCQRAENEFVGMNCGILDQYSSTMGQAGSALLLDCRTLTSRTVTVPGDIRVVICDTEARRDLIGTEYSDRRNQCRAGAARLAAVYPGVTHLRDVSLEQFTAVADQMAPEVARRCRFIIEENDRVLALAEALPAGDHGRIAVLTAASYAGARDLYEIGAPGMAAMMDAMLAAPGVIGARQAGAGFGGCMVAFVEAGQVPAFAAAVQEAYRGVTGLTPRVYPVWAAPGAAVMP